MKREAIAETKDRGRYLRDRLMSVTHIEKFMRLLEKKGYTASQRGNEMECCVTTVFMGRTSLLTFYWRRIDDVHGINFEVESLYY